MRDDDREERADAFQEKAVVGHASMHRIVCVLWILPLLLTSLALKVQST